MKIIGIMFLIISFGTIVNFQVNAIDVRNDGRIVKVEPGGKVQAFVTFVNREEMPCWINVSLQQRGPFMLTDKTGAVADSPSALGWVYVQKGWLQIPPQKIQKFPIDCQPLWNVPEGEYVAWLLFKQTKESPEEIGENQRGKALQTRIVDSFYIPVTIVVEK